MRTAEAYTLQNIDQALRERCRIPAKYYFAAVILDGSDECVTFSGPNLRKDHVRKFFNQELFQRWVENPGTSPVRRGLLMLPVTADPPWPRLPGQ